MTKLFSMKKAFTAFSLCVATLVGSVLLSACNDDGSGDDGETETTTYSITLPAENDIYTISLDKQTAAENETVTLTITLSSVDYSIDSVRYNNSNCTKESETTYTFTMPATDVTISVSTTYHEEVTSDNSASFRAPMPNKVAKASKDDTTATETFYIDFASSVLNATATITSSNEDVIPASAVTLTSRSGDGSYVTALYYSIDLTSVDVGVCYLTFAISSPNNSYSAKLEKKIEVVEYGQDIYDETWTESVTLEFTSSVVSSISLEYITIQVYDTNRQYGTNIGTAQTETPTSREHTITFTYVPNHTYYLSAYYPNPDNPERYLFLNINDVTGSGSNITGFNQLSNGYLTFINDNVNLTTTVTLP